MLADMYKLVDRTHARKDRIIAKHYMACHLGVVAHDAVVANHTIVSDMAVCHDQAIVSHLGGPFIFTAPVDGYKLADGSVITNFYCSILTFVFEVLRNTGNNSTRKNPAIVPDTRPFHDGNIAADPGSFSDFNILMNHTKRINLYIGSQLSIRMNVRVWMNHCFFL
jgi:hypothetical protein